ncbi:zona pellucida protein AX 4 isoform X2 [Hoplias malabaricus]|uniref:zona pellucida protein AX 4 isoform X2 n=1 Tax=Hoplias malabaricus TaxID=27720 RepID=UPI00346239BE
MYHINTVTKMNHKKFLIFALLLGLLSLTLGQSTQDGMFKTECRDRHFLLFVKSHFLGPKFRFEVQGESGVRTVEGHWAEECGYSLLMDSWGDLTLRVSYLACAVDNQDDSDFRLMLWLVKVGPDGEDLSRHPLPLSCSLEESWRPREVVCENNYMEVSVEKRLPPDHRGTEFVTPPPVDDALREWRVMFRVPDLRQHPGSGWTPLKEENIPVNLVHLLGYRIIPTATRIVLRCGYGSRLAYNLQDGEVSVEVVSATVLYRHHWTLLRVDTSVACSTNKGRLEGGDVLLVLPWLLPPLVVSPVREKSLKVAVGGHYITQCVAHNRGYRIHDNNGTIEIRIPFGAEGGRLKSAVSAGVYSQLYEVDVELLRQWQDSTWNQTQRSFRTLRVDQKHTPIITNLTAPSGGGRLAVSVGVFLPDVVLENVTVATRVFNLNESKQNTVQISQLSFPNGTHSYLLQVPFSHPLVTSKYLGGGYRSYSLSLLFSFLLSPDGEVFHVPAAVRATQQDVVAPRLGGECTEHGVRILVHYGDLEAEWSVYVGGLKLDWQLVQEGQYVVDSTEEFLSLEIPLYAPGVDYRGLDLRGLEVSVWVSVVHMATMEEFTHLQECLLPVEELLVCLPDGQMVVLLDLSAVFPGANPGLLALQDSSCVPLASDGSSVMFRFNTETCGTTVTHVDGHVIYTNEVRLLSPSPAHVRQGPHPHLSPRIPLICVYPENEPSRVSIYKPHSPPAPLRPPQHTHTSHKHSTEMKWRPLPAGG